MISKTFNSKNSDLAIRELQELPGDIRLTTWVPDAETYVQRLARFKDAGKLTKSGVVPYPDRNVMMVEIVMLCPEAIPMKMRNVVLRQCCRVLVRRFGERYGNHNIQFARIRENRLEFGFVPMVGCEIAASRCFNDKTDVRPLLEQMNEALLGLEGYEDGAIYPSLFEYFGLKYGR